MQYESHTPLNRLGTQVEFGALGVPPGVAIEPQIVEQLRDVVKLLGLPEAGVVTPWAERVSDVEWKPIVKPDTNVAMFAITQVQVNQAAQLLFGQQIPFLTVYTNLLQPHETVKGILRGTQYELFQTQAVYRQDDPNIIPAIGLLHWVRILDLPQQGSKSMDLAAGEMGGRLMFSQQVPVETTTLRPMPDLPLETVTELLKNLPLPSVIPPIPGGTIPQLPFPIPDVGPSLPFPVPTVPPRSSLPFPIPERMLPFEEQKAAGVHPLIPLVAGVAIAYGIYRMGEMLVRR